MKEKIFRPRWDLTIWVLVTLLAVAIIEFWLRDIQPLWGWRHAARMATIVVTLGLAFVASFIFHVVGELWNSKQERNAIQASIEASILGIFDAFRLLGVGMYMQLDRKDTQHFTFELGDDLALSYDWDAMLSKGGFIEHEMARRMFQEADNAFQERLMELDDHKEYLKVKVRIELNSITACLARVKVAIGSPRLNTPAGGEAGVSYHLNYVGDKINELHAYLYFFKRQLRSEWSCRDPKLKAFLLPVHGDSLEPTPLKS